MSLTVLQLDIGLHVFVIAISRGSESANSRTNQSSKSSGTATPDNWSFQSRGEESLYSWVFLMLYYSSYCTRKNMSYQVNWEKLRRITRIERKERSYREYVACLPGLSKTALHDFLNGGGLNLPQMLSLMDAFQVEPNELIVWEPDQESLF